MLPGATDVDDSHTNAEIAELDVDDWIFSSIKMYESLHMFELQYATQAMDWIGEDCVCVGCLLPNGTTELLQLSLPDKLLANSTDLKGLTKDRDFSFVSGGFHLGRVSSICHIPSTRQLAISEMDTNDVSVWAQDSGVLMCVRALVNPTPESHPAHVCVPSHPAHVMFGSSLASLVRADTETGRTVFSMEHYVGASEPLSGLAMLNDHMALTCLSISGDFYTLDTRTCQATRYTTSQSPHSDDWTFALSHGDVMTSGASDAGRAVAKLSSRGVLEMYDTRDLRRAWGHYDVGVTCPQVEKAGCRGPLHIKFCPSNSSIVSISGYGGDLSLYNTTAASHDVTLTSLTPTFIHQGHVMCSDYPQETVVTCHLWHPRKDGLMLSTASDGSLHAWQAVDKVQKP